MSRTLRRLYGQSSTDDPAADQRHRSAGRPAVARSAFDACFQKATGFRGFSNFRPSDSAQVKLDAAKPDTWTGFRSASAPAVGFPTDVEEAFAAWALDKLAGEVGRCFTWNFLHLAVAFEDQSAIRSSCSLVQNPISRTFFLKPELRAILTRIKWIQAADSQTHRNRSCLRSGL